MDLQELHGYYLEAKPAKPALFCVLICAFDTFELTGCGQSVAERAEKEVQSSLGHCSLKLKKLEYHSDSQRFSELLGLKGQDGII